MHLIIDGYSSNQKILQDEDFLHNLLEDFPSKINMTKISPPYVLKYVGTNSAEWGISGFIFIAESHISIHTFVKEHYVNIDVFSCMDFDADRAIKDLQDKFQLVKLRTCVIDREWSTEPVPIASSPNYTYHGE